MKIAKVIAVLASVLLAACGGPEQFTTSGGVLPQSGARVDLSRITTVDDQGVTTVDVVEVGGAVVDIARVNESTTTAQDYGQTVVAGFTPAAAAGLVQHWLPDENCGSRCGSGAGQTAVQVITSVNNEMAANVRDGCTGPCARPSAD